MSEPVNITAADLTVRPELLGPVKLIGTGGTGGPLSRYGSLYLASLDADTRMILIDGDTFEPSNASRMFFGGDGNKAEVLRQDLLHYLGDGRLALEAVPEYVTPENVERLILDGDTVLLAVDNHATRKLVSDHCATLDNVCLISGGNDGIGKDSRGRELRGTAGNCQAYIRHDGADLTPSLTAYHREIERPADMRPDEAGCSDELESVPQIVFANLAVASTMLNTYWLYLCGVLHYPEIVFDIAEGLMRPVPLPLPSRKSYPTARSASSADAARFPAAVSGPREDLAE